MRLSYSLVDLISPLLTFLFLLIVFYAIYRRKREKQPYYKFFFISFLLKIFGNVLTALMYGMYYGYGDTFGYFAHANEVYIKFMSNPFSFFSVFNSVDTPAATMKVYNISFIFSLFTGNSYLANSLLFTALSVIGGWLVYLVLIDMYPKVKKQLAYCSLFIPSIWFWGNGLQKESLMVFGIGVVFYTFYMLFFKRSFKYLLLLPFGYYAIMVKSYAFYLVILMIVLWVVFHFFMKIRLAAVRFVLIMGFLTTFLAGSAFYFYQSGAGIEILLSESSAVNEAVKTASYLSRITAERKGSGYDLGIPDNSLSGILSKVFPAINVTLFRPYIWEAKKVVNMPAVLESMGLLIFCLIVFVRTKFIGFFKIIFNNPFLIACLVYCMLFSFIVGFTSYNYGALVRYKLPVVMFFYVLIFLIGYEYKEKNANRAIDT